jgi:hypothetical protein
VHAECRHLTVHLIDLLSVGTVRTTASLSVTPGTDMSASILAAIDTAYNGSVANITKVCLLHVANVCGIYIVFNFYTVLVSEVPACLFIFYFTSSSPSVFPLLVYFSKRKHPFSLYVQAIHPVWTEYRIIFTDSTQSSFNSLTSVGSAGTAYVAEYLAYNNYPCFYDTTPARLDKSGK